MASTKFYLDLRGKAKDGKGTVVIVLTNNRTVTTMGTGIRVSPKEWNGESVVRRPDALILNTTLSKLKSDVDMELANLRFTPGFSLLSATQIKKIIEKRQQEAPEPSFAISNLFNEYLEQDLSDGTKGLYRATLEKVLRYAGDCSITAINFKWLKGFEKFLAQTRGVNGRAIDLRNLRAVCNYAVNVGAVSDYAFKNFPIKQEPTKKRNIPLAKLRELYRYPCKGYTAVYRDYFFLMFFLIGVNAKDLFLAKPSAIVDGRFEYSRSKTGKSYSIRIEPEAEELLRQYKGKKYLVEVMDHVKEYKNFLHGMNDALGEIGIDKYGEPLIPDLTSYYARHTWATLAYEAGVPVDVISQALGHSMGNKTTLIYIKPDQLKVDEANRKVIDYFLGKL